MNSKELERHRLEFRDTFAKTGHETLKAMLIVSGGAAVAYLTFLGITFGNKMLLDMIGIPALGTLIFAMQCFISILKVKTPAFRRADFISSRGRG